MNLPEQIPEKLRTSAVPLPDLQDGEGAWEGTDALAVLQSLGSTTVAVSNVSVYEPAPGTYVLADRTWRTDRHQNEPDIEYACRTRRGASWFIRNYACSSEKALFVLTFPMDKDAA